jgi:putative PIN family toxin of toxin-antitoxin system
MRQVPDSANPATTAGALDAVVLDTNTVLDWLVFDDPGARAVGAAVGGSALHWHVCERMLGELAQVLARPAWAERGVEIEIVLERARRLAHPQPAPAVGALRCRDADDQVFLDLAVALRARWLFTRDKDLLALATTAKQRHGLLVMPPARWALPMLREH